MKSGIEIVKVTTQLLIAVALFALAYVFFIHGNRFLDQQAIGECGQLYQVEFTETGTNSTVTTPITEEYQKCLVEAGVR